MANQFAEKVFDLPHSTAHCEDGPLINHAMGLSNPATVRVRYDVEGYTEGNGNTSIRAPLWTTVVFNDVLAMRFTPEDGCTEIMVEAYSCVCKVTGSDWMADLKQRFDDSYTDFNPEYRHFMIFFDHYGCLEVIAVEVEIADSP